jgi:hypothetical protein
VRAPALRLGLHKGTAPVKIPLLSATLPAALLLSAAASAQSLCFGPDLLDTGPCCAPVPLNLPQPLPPFQSPALGVCWQACNPAQQSCIDVFVAPPTPTPQCGTFMAPMQVVDCAGIGLLKGDLILDYTRTWAETAVPGTPPNLQVWRFVAKVDLFGDSTQTPQCPVPPSVGSAAGQWPTGFWYGYYDLAFDCSAGTFEHALVLYHGCDAFQHTAPLSSTPGVFHPATTYAIVAPHTVANPFVPVPFPTPGGPLLSEAVRSTSLPNLPGACIAEEFVPQGVLLPLASGCLCPLGLVPQQQTASTLLGGSVCGSSFSSLNFWPTAPWFDFVTTSIGTWSTGLAYPGPERAVVGEGLFLYREACSPAAQNQSLDVFYGGLTLGGYLVAPTPTAPNSQNFLDLASNYSAVLPGAIPFPLVGDVRKTEHLIYVNF